MNNNSINQVSVADLCGLREILLPINRLESLIQKSLRLSLNQAMVLCSLARGPANTPKTLSDQLGLSPPVLSRILGTLEEKQFIRRVLSPSDKRSHLLELTSRGNDLSQDIEAWQKMAFPIQFPSVKDYPKLTENRSHS